MIERLCERYVGPKSWNQNFAAQFLLGLTTYIAVLVAWVFFRASDFTIATRMLRGMFGGHPQGDAILTTLQMLQITFVTLGLFIAHWSLRNTSLEAAVARMPRWLVTGIWVFMASAIILTQGNSNAFIYFQF